MTRIKRKGDVNMSYANTPIRNRRIRRDFKRLLQLLADAKDASNASQEDYQVFAEVERIAERNGLGFNDDGQVMEGV